MVKYSGITGSLAKVVLGLSLSFVSVSALAESVKIGLNYPETGPYSVQGKMQRQASDMAVEEINAAGGIMGKKIELVYKDTKSNEGLSEENVASMIDNDGVQMVFGGSSSAVAISGGKVAKAKDKLYFGTLTYSNATTGKEGHTHMFRECYNAWQGAKVLAKYLKNNFAGKKFYYITADYTWGWTTEESIRHFSDTMDDKVHQRSKTPFPGATEQDFRKALTIAKASRPDVLVLVLFGKDMSDAVNAATSMGLKRNMAIVVPNLTLGMAKSAGPKVMEGVVGALPWTWRVPYMQKNQRGIKFVEDFAAKYKGYPSTSAASAYSILYQYKDAVERAGSFDTSAVRKALSGHKYSFLKDEQEWRAFDQQNVQTVFAVKAKSQQEVLSDKFQEDYFEIIDSMSGSEAAITFDEWKKVREKANKPLELQ